MRVLFLSLSGLSSALVMLLATSCGTGGHHPTPMQRRADHRVLYRWYDDGGDGKVTIRISLTDQIAEFKRGERNIGWCYVATGKEGHGTTPGSYRITEKIEDKHSNLYGWFEDEFGNVTDGDARSRDKVPGGMVYVPAPMPYWMRLTSAGVGMHGGLIPQPGEPASHGCIRLPKDFVQTLYDVVNVGTPVVITNAPSTQGPAKSIDPPMPTQSWGNAGGMDPGSVQSVRYRNGVPETFE